MNEWWDSWTPLGQSVLVILFYAVSIGVLVMT